jgi:hypothetical protein
MTQAGSQGPPGGRSRAAESAHVCLHTHLPQLSMTWVWFGSPDESYLSYLIVFTRVIDYIACKMAPLPPVGQVHGLFILLELLGEVLIYIGEVISIYDILGLRRKEAAALEALCFGDLQTRPTEVLDLTSLPVNELAPLAPPFEAAFPAHMALWRLEGKPRTARR